jgi:hypothetical protein
MTQYNFESIFAGKSDFLSNAKFSGGLNLESSANVKEIFEKVCVYGESAYQEIEIDINKGSLHNYTSEATGNFTFNIKGLNSIPIQKSIVVTILINMGSSAYVISNPSTTGFKIDGTAVTVKWISSSPPSSGFTNSINSYNFAIIKNTTTSYTVLGTLTRFG